MFVVEKFGDISELLKHLFPIFRIITYQKYNNFNTTAIISSNYGYAWKT